MTTQNSRGSLIIIGGAEDKQADMTILKKVIKACGKEHPQIAVITTATNSPAQAGKEYDQLLKQIGAGNVCSIHMTSRDAADDEQNIRQIHESDCIFFTGGDQLRISSILGGTKAHEAVLECYENGKVIAGTSAGASMMSEIMVVEGQDEAAPRKCTMKMAPGMGLLKGVIIDQHFNQRGRIGRLLGAVAQNPEVLGIGIDEDTAVLVNPDLVFTVEGSGVVTVVDGRSIRFTNISEQHPDDPLALTNVTLHVLPRGFGFDIQNRKEHME